MTHKDIFAFILSEATGLDLIDTLHLLHGGESVFLDSKLLAEEISCDQALMALAIWGSRKIRMFETMMQSAPEALGRHDLS
ncbi:MAG: hypothetical protein ACOWWM_06265 [Desulfobacterales bacterium]